MRVSIWRVIASLVVASGAFAQTKLPDNVFVSPGDGEHKYTFPGSASEELIVRAEGYVPVGFPDLRYSTTLLALAIETPSGAVLPASATSLYRLPESGQYTVTVTFAGSYGRLGVFRWGTGCVPVFDRFDVETSFYPKFDGQGGGRATFSIHVPAGCTVNVQRLSSCSASDGPLPPTLNGGYFDIEIKADPHIGPARTCAIAVGALVLSKVQKDYYPCTFLFPSKWVDVPVNGSPKFDVPLTNTGSYPCPLPTVENESFPEQFVYPVMQFDPGKPDSQPSFSARILPNFRTQTRNAKIELANRSYATFAQQPNPGTAQERFIQFLYFGAFGRLPSPAEIAGQIGTGMSQTDMATFFLTSEEFNLGSRFAAGLYVALLNRNAEHAGWLLQRDVLGTTKRAIGDEQFSLVYNFLATPEFNLQHPNLTAEEFVRLLYAQVLLRTAREDEVAFQIKNSGDLSKPGLPRARLARDFLNTPEFRLGVGPRLTASLIYYVLYQREPTSTEHAALVKRLSDGASVRSIVAEIVTGTEFTKQLQ